MSYFSAQTGTMPIPTPHGLRLWTSGPHWELSWPAAPSGITAVLVLGGDAEPLAVVERLPASSQRWPIREGLGRWISLAWERGGVAGPAAPAVELTATATPPAALCPLCRGILVQDQGLWRCSGRCTTRWLASDGHLIDLAALPFGICGCCAIPQALVRGEIGAICPSTHQVHIIIVGGRNQPVKVLSHAWCGCCAPPRPLVQSDDQIVCPVQPHNRYALTIDGWQPATQASQSQTLEAIDTALKTNTAKWTLYGLFDE